MKIDAWKIRIRMSDLGLTQEGLARRCGITNRQTISAVLTRGTCTMAMCKTLADGLDLGVEDIVRKERTDERDPAVLYCPVAREACLRCCAWWSELAQKCSVRVIAEAISNGKAAN